MGPVTGLTLDMLDNWMRPNSFKWATRFHVGRRFRRKSKAAAGLSATALCDHIKVASGDASTEPAANGGAHFIFCTDLRDG